MSPVEINLYFYHIHSIFNNIKKQKNKQLSAFGKNEKKLAMRTKHAPLAQLMTSTNRPFDEHRKYSIIQMMLENKK